MKNIIEQNKEWINATWEKVDRKLARTAIKSRKKYPIRQLMAYTMTSLMEK